MRSWTVDTIYEEEEEEEEEKEEEEEEEEKEEVAATAMAAESSSLPPQSPAMLSLQSKVDEWSRSRGSKTDAVVCAGDHKLYLHKVPLASRSGFLKRHLTDVAAGTVVLPAPVTAEAFAAVAAFCYAGEVAFTPSNVASLSVAAEWLEMTEDDGSDGHDDGNLLERADRYFCRHIAGNPEAAAAALRACEELIQSDAETASGIAGRCVEALAAAECGGRGPWLDEVAALPPTVAATILHAMRPRFAECHDGLYAIVDKYLKRHKGELTEEEKNHLCSAVDCRKLSVDRLVHLVRNPHMPLRFLVQAMLLPRSTKHIDHIPHDFSAATASLGAILRHDAALRRASHLRAAMELTNERIRCLESDVAELKRQLKEAKEGGALMGNAPGRSASLRLFGRERETRAGLGRRLVEGLRGMFHGRSSSSVTGSFGSTSAEEARPRKHGRSHSFA